MHKITLPVPDTSYNNKKGVFKNDGPKDHRFLALGLCLACGLIISSYFLSNALKEIKMAERYVTVKGLSERIVEADLAIWNISFRNSANDLEELQNDIDDNKAKLYNFLLGMGFLSQKFRACPPNYRHTISALLRCRQRERISLHRSDKDNSSLE